MEIKYKRVLLKLSGEVLMGDRKFGHDLDAIDKICEEIKEVSDMGVEVIFFAVYLGLQPAWNALLLIILAC
jgi:uridylate kinase